MSVDMQSEAPNRAKVNEHILIAEDDRPLGNFLQKHLQGEDYSVDLALDGEVACQAVSRAVYHLLILDLNLPKLDGISVLKQLRQSRPSLPVLVLTGRTRVEDRVLSLDSGADDCLIKPFAFSELSARVRALLRRNSDKAGNRLQVGDLILDSNQWYVERAGRRLDLTTKEFGLLEYLMRNARRTVTRSMIMENVWNEAFDPSTNLVDVYIKYVRDKVDADFPSKLVRTVRGVGYVLSD
jgi:DNA-binding response OmpR family regulator